MTDNKIVQMPTPLDILAKRIRAAFERTEHGRREWIEGTLELACALAEARERFPSNGAFAAWLGEHELDWIGKNDRAALIAMAADSSASRLALEQTKLSAWQLIWREMQSRVPTDRKMEVYPDSPTSVDDSSAAPDVPKTATAESAVQAEPPAPRVKVDVRNPLHGWPRIDEVLGLYRHAKTRTMLGKASKERGGKDFYALILEAIDAGFPSEPTQGVIDHPTLRLLFPDAPSSFCSRFDLTKPADRKRVRDEILPAAAAMRRSILAEPARLDEFLSTHRKQREILAHRERAERQAAAALKAMPGDQQRIVFYGETLWPLPEFKAGSYTYDQIRCAVWYFRDIEAWLKQTRGGESVESRTIMIRLTMKWFLEYSNRIAKDDGRDTFRRVFSLVHVLADLMKNNPSGECRWPAHPSIEGQW